MKKLSVTLFILLRIFSMPAQSLDWETMTKDTKLKINGGINANTLFYNSNAAKDAAAPFSYMLSGNLNLSFMTFSMPFSYTLTDQGKNLNYNAPFNFNRLSLSPKYKWVQAYIGDHTLSFSPYTLNGHPFRGLGLVLSPRGAFHYSLMGGRLLKAVTPNDSLGLPGIYQRYGYGAMLKINKEKYKIETIGFYAQDDRNSLNHSASLIPKSNYVGSLKISSTLIQNLNFEVEYAVSFIQEYTPFWMHVQKDSLLQYSKSMYHNKAFNTKLAYTIGKTRLGLVYENVDPTYQTFGALYFNNDLENVGLTFSRNFFKERLTLATQMGYQTDNLARQKAETAVRMVGSGNIGLKITEQLNLSASYSNLSSTTNKRLNQFDYINRPVINMADTLDYQQLSQTANMGINYLYGKNKSINFNTSISGQANKQGDIIRRGQASNIQNYSLSHNVAFPAIRINWSTALNYTGSITGLQNNQTLGGTLNITKRDLEDKLNTGLGILYNQTAGNSVDHTTVFGVKINAAYTFLERHNLTLYGIQMFRILSKQENINDLTMNFNYSYSF